MYDQRIADLEKHLAAATAERDEAKAESAARLKQLLTQIKMDRDAIEEWRKDRDKLREERDALAALIEQYPPEIELGHVGSCGPESGCDGVCMEAASIGQIMRTAATILAARDQRVRREALEEAARLSCTFCVIGSKAILVDGQSWVHERAGYRASCSAWPIRDLLRNCGTGERAVK